MQRMKQIYQTGNNPFELKLRWEHEEEIEKYNIFYEGLYINIYLFIPKSMHVPIIHCNIKKICLKGHITKIDTYIRGIALHSVWKHLICLLEIFR